MILFGTSGKESRILAGVGMEVLAMVDCTKARRMECPVVRKDLACSTNEAMQL